MIKIIFIYYKMTIKGPIIIITLVILALFIASKQYPEGFGNVNPQGSYNSQDTFNPGSSVDTVRINKNMIEPGPGRSLNMSSVKSAFPYNRNLPEFYDDNDIGLIKSDGVALGSYTPYILRPFDSVTANPSKGSDCKWPCYSDKKFQQWCSEKNAIEYHAMRPIMSSSDYNNNLTKLFKNIIDKNGPKMDSSSFEQIKTAVFCTETQKSIMSWLMQKIAVAVNKMPECRKMVLGKQKCFMKQMLTCISI